MLQKHNMDDKELIRRIKNSYSSGMSRSEITRKMQNKGYRLEYIDALLKKSKSKKTAIFICIFLMLLILAVLSYTFLYTKEKFKIPNPLSAVTGYAIANQPETTNIEITPKFITYLLNELGVYKLHKNILTGEPAIINIDLQGKKFYSTIDNEIKTNEGASQNPDIVITTLKEEIINALSKNPEEYIKQSINQGRTKIIPIASKSELFAKGYFSIYNSLKV